MGTAEKMVAPAFRIRGSKFKLAKWIISFFPLHRVYIEAFGGAGSVLLHKAPTDVEIFNDIDGDIVNFFRVVRNREMNALLCDMLDRTPFARAEFDEAFEHTDEPVERARRLIVRTEMGMGSMYEHDHAGFRTDSNVTSKPKTAQAYWGTVSDRLHPISRRLKGVLIENRPALDVMRKHDGHDVLHYVDPPYLPDVREPNRNSQKLYRYEMTVAEHEKLLNGLLGLEGMVILSGYDNDLYNDMLSGWKKESKEALVSAFRGTKKQIECLWINPSCVDNRAKQSDFQKGLLL